MKRNSRNYLLKKLKSLYQRFRRLKIVGFESNNDFLLCTSDKCCRNHAEFLEKSKENKFQLVVVAEPISMFADVDILDKYGSKTYGKDGKKLTEKNGTCTCGIHAGFT